jgi:hypothetical protein
MEIGFQPMLINHSLNWIILPASRIVSVLLVGHVVSSYPFNHTRGSVPSFKDRRDNISRLRIQHKTEETKGKKGLCKI